MATHSSILAWELLWTKEPGGLQSMMSQKGYNWAGGCAYKHTHTHTHIHTYTQHGYNRGSRRAFLENKFKSNACGVRMCVDFVEEKMNLTAIHKFAKSNGDGNEHWGKMS